jgi:hypothetical protein
MDMTFAALERLARRLFCAFALSVVALVALAASVAKAEPPKLVSYGNFATGEAYTAADAVDNSCSLHVLPLTGSACTTFDASSGDLYVADSANKEFSKLGHVDKFSAGGERLSPPSPFGDSPPVFGGLFDAGAAVNPVNGDLYVLEALNFMTGSPEIATYDPSTGAPVGLHFPVEASGSYTFVQIAADSAGNVYVPVVPQNEVLEYDPAACQAAPPPCVPLKTFTGGAGGGKLKEPTGVAVDSSGNVWVADHGNNRIEELSSTGVPVEVNGKPVAITSEGVESVALDGHSDVFAIVRNKADSCGSVESPCPHLLEYTSTGVQVADVGAGSFGVKQGTAPLSTVAVNEASGRVYATDGLKGLVWVFGPPTAPIIGRELTSEVTTSEAKLGALIDPGGIETSYRFEFDTREYREGEGPHGQSTPFPEGSVGEGVTARTVWAAASGLEPGTIYHYRVVATNELEPHGVYGPDQTFTTQTAAQAVCPENEEFRGGFSHRLPDCRAYELVIPPVKNSSQPSSAGPVAADGNALEFGTKEPLPGAPSGGYYYVATRGPGGWSSEDLIPLESYSGILCNSRPKNSQVEAYTDKPSGAVLTVGLDTRASGGEGGFALECNAEGLQVVSGEPVGYGNLLVRDGATGAYRLVNAPPPGVTPADAHFNGASADLSRVVFTEMAPLAPGASYGVENLFEWDEGALRLLTILPNGTPANGSLAAEGANKQYVTRPISADGSHILFTSGGSLYDRIGGERTVQVDEKQAGAAGPSGGGVLQTASTDGSRALFLDESKLTAGSTAQAGEPDLYECVLLRGASKCELTDLTVARPGEHANVLGVAELGGEDSSHVYFTAKGVLATNKREYTDSEGKSVVEEAKSGEDNLYLDREGTIAFIATLNETGTRGSVSPDGTWFAFDSNKSLTGYDNAVVGGGQLLEIFLYHAATGQLVCASCNPSGEAPVAGGAELSGATARPVSNGGRVFFETGEALVPSDTNGKKDVYEYENGQPFLISSGTSANESTFVGASESGDNAFFQSTQALVPQDTQEEEHVIYDARVGGGFPAIASPPACTTADACRSVPALQPPFPSAGVGTAAVFGEDNLAGSKPAVKAKSFTRGQKLARALSACHKQKNKRKRAACERRARKSYGAKASRSRRLGMANASRGGGK